MVDHVQTKREIEAILSARGLRPRTRFGQHFLIDGNLMRRLVESAELSADDLVIEVGPGTGGLTDLLCTNAGRVFCVEIDRDLAEILSSRFAERSSVEIVCTDALASKHRVADSIAEAIGAFDSAGGGAVKLVANLPYQIATPLVMNLVVAYPAVRRLCFTVQAEVGDRLIASPGLKDFGPLAIMTQLLFSTSIVARIGPASFWPRPAIDSVMMRMDAIESPFDSPEDAQKCATFVRNVFEYRRKTLRGALGYVVESDVRDLLAKDVDLTQRPEQIPVAQWLAMSRIALAL
jgi:16S rRNA (adenine1518-N6/adenine1519-N6)-dimethyltransferase